MTRDERWLVHHVQGHDPIRIRWGDATGTAVVFGAGNHPRVVVTAAHLLSGATAGDRIAIRHKDDWGFLVIQSIRRAPDGHDVCALLPATQIGEGLPVETLSAHVYLGEDVAFCGFPLGLEMKGHIEPAYPTPLVKGGIFSGAIEVGPRRVILIDALNNSGFSGGPIVRMNQQNRQLTVVGLISGYKYDKAQPIEVLDERGVPQASATHFVRANSGFMYGVGAEIVRPLVELTASDWSTGTIVG